jgi:hypothetical protein
MFGKLPDLFDRNFAIGFFLPVTVFVAITAILADAHGLLPELLDFNISDEIDVLVGTTIIALVSWLASIILLGINRELTRLLEGYGNYNPFKILHRLELKAYDKYHNEIDKMDDLWREHLDRGEEVPKELITRRSKMLWQVYERFPGERGDVLPTSFGNTIRAFEYYPMEMYGIDAIPGWNRLLTVIPREYKENIDDAKVFVDFWMNTFYLNILLLIEYLGLLYFMEDAKFWFLPGLFSLVIYVSYGRACRAATLWGDTVKSAFDVFLPDLWEKLGFMIPESKEEKKELWVRFSQAVLYGREDYMPDRKQIGKDKK